MDTPDSLWGRNMQEIYAHSFFRKRGGFSSGWPCCTAPLYWLFKVPAFSVWLSKVLDTSVPACRGVYLLLPVLLFLNCVAAPFCYSAWRGLLLAPSAAQNFLGGCPTGVPDTGKVTAFIDVVQQECNLSNDLE